MDKMNQVMKERVKEVTNHPFYQYNQKYFDESDPYIEQVQLITGPIVGKVSGIVDDH
jgi:hypothetical protein